MTAEHQAYQGQPFEKTVIIPAPAAAVWRLLTVPELMKQWMSETEIDIITDWETGGPILIQGPWYKSRFENKGTVLQFEPERVLRYTHLSSLSRLPDLSENYTLIDFRLSQENDGTALTLRLSNFATETIYRHLAFYWNVTLELIKKQATQ